MEALSNFVGNSVFPVPVQVNPTPLSSSLRVRVDQKRWQHYASLSIGTLPEEFSEGKGWPKPLNPEQRRQPESTARSQALLVAIRRQTESQGVWTVLESFCKQHKGGGQVDFRAAVRELRRQHEWQKLIQVLEWYLHSDWLKPTVNTFNLLMEAYGRVGAMDKAEAIFDSLPSATCIPSLDSYNVLLAAYLRVGQLDKAEEAYASLQVKGYKPEVVTYNLMMEVASQRGEPERAHNLLRAMLRLGLKPTLNSYTILMNAYGRVSYANYTMQVASHIVPVTDGGWEGVIGPQEGMVAETERLFARLHSLHLLPDLRTYAALLHAYAQKGMVAQAEKSFGDLSRMGLVPDVYCYNALMEAYSRGGRGAGVEEVFVAMKRAKCTPDLATFHIRMEAYGKDGNWEEAERVLKELRTLKILRPTPKTTLYLLQAYANAGQVEKAKNVAQQVKGMKALPLLLRAHARAGQVGKVEEMVREMGLGMDVGMYAQVIKELGACGLQAEAEDKFLEVSGREGGADLGCWNAFISVYARKRLFRKCTAVFRSMRMAGVHPDEETKEVLKSACRSVEQEEEVMQLLSKELTRV